MKTRLLWIAIAMVGLTALYFGITQPNVSSIPRYLRDPVADLKPTTVPALEPPALVMPPTPVFRLPPIKAPARTDPILSRPELPLQNAATIDFSIGAPVVKMQGKDQDALDAALTEIAEATEGVKIEAKK